MEILLFCLFLCVIFLLFSKYIKNYDEIQNNENEVDYKIYYKAKKYVVTYTELDFYKKMEKVAKKLDLVLLTQVSLYNIINVRNTTDKIIAFNKIRGKSIDFVLVDEKSCEVKLCIQLDDYTHSKPKIKEKDIFLNNLLSCLDIKLLRVKVSEYDTNTIEDQIKEVIFA